LTFNLPKFGALPKYDPAVAVNVADVIVGVNVVTVGDKSLTVQEIVGVNVTSYRISVSKRAVTSKVFVWIGAP
jgi:hypothetical protein